MEAGLFASLKPSVEVCDQQIKNVVESQSVLQTYIQSLSAELDKAPITDIPGLKDYNTKLALTKKRLAGITATVERINARLENIRTMVRRKGTLQIESEHTSKGDQKDLEKKNNESVGIPSISDLISWEDAT
mmetsp:Transcript_12650/g.14980  ORF Transcript_12650/g.14980 Transcript_12650/m.14980 type:complete len:132 (+) Transcript_12650:49-444(+)|eukprot:jgi/Bigna1/71131/fgenesh1_pg.14_\